MSRGGSHSKLINRNEIARDKLYIETQAGFLQYFDGQQIGTAARLSLKKIEDLSNRTDDALRRFIPCYICKGAGNHDWHVCGACEGTKKLILKPVVCPLCHGTGEGTAFVATYGDIGLCSFCLGEKNIYIDKFGKQAWLDHRSAMNLPHPQL